MQSKSTKKKQSLKSTAYIHVVGMNKLQNDLLLSFLKEKTSFDGKCVKKLEYVNPVQKKVDELSQFLLIDWTSIDKENIWNDINSCKNTNSCQCIFAFCNVDPKMEIEKLALTNNIKGLFYKNDPVDIIPKGICAILNGDLWYSRKTLAKCVLDTNPSNNFLDHADVSNLTLRQKQILILMVSGCGNKEIAKELCVSFHTVKTHLYNIYKKLNVDSRFQAALWAAKYL